MVFFINCLALVCWLSIVLLVCYYAFTKRNGKQLSIIIVLCTAFLVWFYYPRQTHFPPDEFAPEYVRLTTPSVNHQTLKTNEPSEQSEEILALCNQICASRRLIPTLFRKPTMGGELYIYFSGKGENWAETRLSLTRYGRRNNMVKNKQVYFLWNAKSLYQQICDILEENPG